MTLVLTVPEDSLTALSWVSEFVFGQVLGLQIPVHGGAEGTISLEGEGRALQTPSFFPTAKNGSILKTVELPKVPLPTWELEAPVAAKGLPILFGSPDMAVHEDVIRCEADILGAIFFMLSRFEEVVLPDRDEHDRFPATASLAYRGGFLYRPLADEYVELLWHLMQRLWPRLQRRRREGRIQVSCDVDQPFDRAGTSVRRLCRSLGGDLVKRRDLILASRRVRNFFAHRKGDFRFDPYHTFDWYMDMCEKNGRRAAFYFISDHSAGAIDGTYSITEPRVLDLIRKLAGRGHELGVHGSYNTFRNGAQINKERRRMIEACEMASVQAEIVGNRQHYLRWDTAETPDHLDSAGFGYDTTGSFADRPGFRYGTSQPFRMWSWRKEAPLHLRQKPLVLMECSVIADNYLALGYGDETRDLMLMLKRRALRYGGDFNLLWHNSHLLTGADRDLFCELIR